MSTVGLFSPTILSANTKGAGPSSLVTLSMPASVIRSFTLLAAASQSWMWSGSSATDGMAQRSPRSSASLSLFALVQLSMPWSAMVSLSATSSGRRFINSASCGIMAFSSFQKSGSSGSMSIGTPYFSWASLNARFRLSTGSSDGLYGEPLGLTLLRIAKNGVPLAKSLVRLVISRSSYGSVCFLTQRRILLFRADMSSMPPRSFAMKKTMVDQSIPSTRVSLPSTMSCGPIPTILTVCSRYLNTMFMLATCWMRSLPLVILPSGRRDWPESSSRRACMTKPSLMSSNRSVTMMLSSRSQSL
mmetsp:Transcript_11964/g.32295  ORF Transcript_11964/g.32295 Transcript_11964/m.32295 type:complete len:302 (+) Transcript_11964:94-999(+)